MQNLARPSLHDLTKIQGVTLARDLKKDCLPFSRLDQGLEKGRITEWVGPMGCGKSELALQLLKENPETRCVWIEEEFTAFPSAFGQFGANLEQILFIQAKGADLIWAASQALRSGLFQVLVLHSNQISAMDFRRLQLIAEKSQACVLILRERASTEATWALQSQWKVGRLFSIPQLYSLNRNSRSQKVGLK